MLIRLNESATVEVEGGREVTLVLPDNATTGYRWSCSVTSGGAQVARQEFIPSESTRVGAGGERHFVVRLDTGSSRIVFRLTRSWGGKGPLREVEVTLVAKQRG
jgi:predicted secreted protein